MPFRKINELVKALADAEQGMSTGTLSLEGLETACADARELFERLVVLRHKAREARIGITAEAPAKGPAPKPETPAPKAHEAGSLRLDTRPIEVSPRQTSLIEAIESTEKELDEVGPAVFDEAAEVVPKKEAAGKRMEDPPKDTATKATTKSAPSVAEKLEKARVEDLGKAISLSHKFWFVAELFNGDRINYERSIEKLNHMADRNEAQVFVENEVIAKLKKPADAEALATFTDLVQRRYA
ncbi:MAG: hypothetical protein R2818_00985 [Flavobacteriales bacterium]